MCESHSLGRGNKMHRMPAILVISTLQAIMSKKPLHLHASGSKTHRNSLRRLATVQVRPCDCALVALLASCLTR